MRSLVLTSGFSGSDAIMIKLIDTSTAVGKRDYAFDAAAVEPRFNGQCF